MIVIEGGAVATVDAWGTEHRPGHVVIDGDRVVAVGPGAAHRYPEPVSYVDATGCLVTPGLVNAHHHLYQWATRGLAQQQNLFGWLTELYPIWAGIDEEVVGAAAAAGLGWLALSGCTTSTDHHYVFPRGRGDLFAATIEAATAVGMRFHPARGSMDLGSSAGGLPPDDLVEKTDEALAATQEAIDRFHDPSPGAMVRVAVAPCSPFSVTSDLMRESAALARNADVRLHTHLAETLEESSYCRSEHGCTPVEYAEQLGFLGDDVWLAHGVHCSATEIARLGATGTGVAHCPSSNARLGAGIAPVRDLLDAHVPVGLGVDGAASQEAGQLGAELRQALYAARLRGGPAALTVRQALALGTIGGARCLGRADELGSLEPGKLADVAVWRLDGLGHEGIDDPVAALVLGPPAVVDTSVPGAVGDDARRPDGTLKVLGEFAYSSDLWARDMLWGATLRSPHPRARIRGIDLTEALTLPGVYAVLTHEDVPGAKLYGLEIADQPVLAIDQVRYQGEPVAIVAADHPETARRAAARITVDYEVLTPVADAEAALRPDADAVHPTGNLLRHVPVRRGDPAAAAEVVVSGEFQVGTQDQAFLGPESGLAVPAEDGGIDLYIATQWLHVDQKQVAACLGLPADKVRLTLAGVGGAFGAREDLSMQVHASMLALRTGRPVKMMYGREESFFGHVHRHPATMRYELGAHPDGELVYVRAGIILDGGAYTSSSTAVCANAATLGVGPYRVPNVVMDAYVAYTNNPPCGAMRGFGAVQACFGYESMMDRLAAALGVDPVEVRIRNALTTGDTMPTGQVVDGPAPVAQLLHLVASAPAPKPASDDLRQLPGGVSNTTHGEGVVRGVGYAVSIKNVGFSEGFDDYATARVRLHLVGGSPAVVVHTSAVEVGQGLVTVQAQIARTELGVEQVIVAVADTSVGSAGSTSASRQTYMTGGAVRAACIAVRERALSRVGGARLVAGTIIGDSGEALADLADVLRDGAIEETMQWRHRPTEPLDPVTGQGNAHVQYAFAAHRATVDVDTELGLVRVVEIATAQDVGKAINPQAVLGQIHGGTAQGLGLALMEEIQLVDGVLRNPSFTDYLIPTILDMPPMHVDVLELGDPHAPYGLRGVGEPPTISSTPAIVAAIRAATGRPLTRVPVRPEHIVGR